MKVVLFCGGLGMRMRDFSQDIPKPMVSIGDRPIVWHVMKYYAHHGHKDFILCLGYKGNDIKQYFLKYDECVSNDFVLTQGGSKVKLLSNDIQDWTITFLDTGLHSNIGQRLVAIRDHVKNEEMFLANYTDGLTSLPLKPYIERFVARNKTACLVSVRPTQTFHLLSTDGEGLVRDISHVGSTGIWMNGGFYIFRQRIFDYIREGEELVNEPFQRLIEARELVAYQYDGFWACVDTFKEKQQFDAMFAEGNTPWQVWKRPEAGR